MPLQSSGALALGDVNVELGLARTTANRALGGATTRTLYGVASGAIRLAADGYGKSNLPLAGQSAYTTPGTYSWIAPTGVTAVSVVCVGGGGVGRCAAGGAGGGGGGLGWKNNIAVSPGSSYTVFVGTGSVGNAGVGTGQTSYFINTSTVAGNGGQNATVPNALFVGGGFVGDGGGTGGNGGRGLTDGSGGGGAGGYNGGGGDTSGRGGLAPNPTTVPGLPQPGSNGGGGGGGTSEGIGVGAGGGVGILGQGANGTATTVLNNGGHGGGGSGGAAGSASGGGAYGGGGSGADSTNTVSGKGGNGAVRIIWRGSNVLTRAFPSTNTGNV